MVSADLPVVHAARNTMMSAACLDSAVSPQKCTALRASLTDTTATEHNLQEQQRTRAHVRRM